MQSLTLLVLVATAGVCLFAAVQHLLVAWQGGRVAVHLSFALLALCVTGFALAYIWPQSPAEHALAAKWQASFACLWNVALLWFVVFFTGVRPRGPAWALTIPSLVFLAANLALPLGLLHSETSALASFTPPWAARNVRLSLWGLAFYLFGVVQTLFLLHACRSQYRRGERQSAVALGIGLVAMLAALLNDLMMELRLIQFMYLSEFGFLPLVVTMSLQLSREFEESREQLRRLTAAAFEGIAIICRGRIIDANEQMALMLGLERSELLGRSVMEFVAPESFEQVRAAIQSGEEGPYEHLARRQDGSTFPVEVRARPIPLEGRPARVTVVRDITDRKRAERLLHESQERYRNFIALSAEGIARVDFRRPIPLALPLDDQVKAFLEHGFLAECNDAFARLRGWASAREIQGKGISDYMEVSDAVNRQNLLRFFEAGHRATDVVTHGRDAEGQDKYFLNNAVGVVQDGLLKHVWTVQRDITERMRAERALRESEERLRLGLEAAQMGTWAWELEANRVVWSADVERLFGLPPGSFAGTFEAFVDLVLPEERPHVRTEVEATMEGRKPEHVMEFRIRWPNGDIHWLEGRGHVFRNANGRPVRMTGTVVDVTERKQAEQALRQVRERELRAQEEFTRQLISAQEQERKRLANELHDSLGQNLSLIKNRSAMASREPGLAPNVTAHLDAVTHLVSAAIDEVRGLVRNLQPMHIEQVGLTMSLEGLIEQVAESMSLRIDRRLEKVDDLLKGEEATHIYRIVQEALNNIIKHAKATRASVTVERDLPCIRIKVEDDGCGFDSSGVSEAVRAGIGLASLQERARMLGGSFEIWSAPGGGTRLRIELPLGASHVEPPSQSIV